MQPCAHEEQVLYRSFDILFQTSAIMKSWTKLKYLAMMLTSIKLLQNNHTKIVEKNVRKDSSADHGN